MSESAIYALVLVVYMGLLIAVGVWTSRRVKSSEDFYAGGRSVGPWVTSLSYVAAYFSSVVIIGGGGFGYRYGMATIWIAAINVLVGCTLAWIVLGKRVRRFTARLGVLTIPGFFAERYRSKHAFEVLMGMPYMVAVLLSAVIIILYVSLGGYLAVVWTGFFQAWVMGVGLILLTVAALNAVGGLTAANISLASIDAGLVHTPGDWGWAGLVSFALITSLGVWGMPQMLARFVSMRDVRVLRVGTVVVTIGGAMAVLPYINGAIARVLHPDLASADLAIPTLTKAVLSPWGAAIFLAGVVAAGMSSFSAILLTTSSAVVRDVMQKGFGRDLSERQVIRYGRVVSVVVGVVSLAIALRPPALVLVLMAFASATIASTCLWPLLFGLYWKRTTRWGVLASMVSGLAASLVWMSLGSPFGLHGFIPGIGVSLFAIVFVSLMTRRLPDDHVARVWGADGGT